MPDFPLTREEVASLCAAARRGLAHLSSEADPNLMGKVWGAMGKLGEWFEACEKIKAEKPPEHIEKAAP